MAQEPEHPPANPLSLKIASYNIRKAVGLDWVRNPLRILSVLSELDADIVVLQEADRRFGRRASALPQILVSHHTDYRPVPLDVQRDSMGWHGNAILVREWVEVEHHDILHIPYLEPRGVVTARLGIEGRRLAVFGMHLDLSGLWRARQARAIAEMAEEALEDMPTVMMGDLNEWRRNAGVFREFSRHFTVLDCGRSFPARRPVARLDRIMHCDGVAVEDYGVHDTALAAQASDHLPVWAQIAI